ncbi:MAG: glutaminyl-peptide cyclotransferase [Bacteroidales bacterium]|jgi:glutamine cyclotransferase|nr:glutaminyl-peptide cyclotransferase [Bacteroidales bacterium]
MKNRIERPATIMLLMLLAAFHFGCSGRSGRMPATTGPGNTKIPGSAAEKLIRMQKPAENAELKLGEAVMVVLEMENPSQPPDSVMISFDGRLAATLRSAPWTYSIPPSMTASTGRKSVKAAAYRNGKTGNVITRFVIVYSDTPPRRYGYKVVHTYPHDREAFTQGLFYHNGVLYEGTGQQTGSTLREVELATGKVLRILNLRADLFGEGITLFRDMIYQVTWQSKVGFVYERETFRQIKQIYYQSEGWGLTTMDDRIVMSDGSNSLYFYDPESFTVLSRIEVYDNEQLVDSLNELEYINGEIWANIWMKDLIARIDPKSGKVNGYINLKGILKDPGTDTGVDVLNGIAWDREGGRIFVTGKNWPKLFEISVTE